ncbi:MAG TPA: lyase family protein, partial [Longimicrobiaceae bacterium]|nr:lyase family protein [Longimicrobiaceae bacterium]
MTPETATAPATARLWGGRFAAGPAADMDRLNRSLPVDFRLWREDVAGSRAWAGALAAAGVITFGECDELQGGLDQVAARLSTWTEADGAGAPDEDIHSLVERLLYQEAGDVAGKLHTGRSRNDQVATDSRLWALGAISRLDTALRDLQRALLEQA